MNTSKTIWKEVAEDLIECVRHGDRFSMSGTCLGCAEVEFNAVESKFIEGGYEFTLNNQGGPFVCCWEEEMTAGEEPAKPYIDGDSSG